MKAYRAALIWTAIAFAGTGVHAAPAKPPGKSTPAKAPAKAAPAKSAPAKTRAKSAAAAKPVPAKPVDAALQTISYPAGVTGMRDLVYAALPGFRPLTLDLYLPHHDPKDFPKALLIFVHGGNWNSGDDRQGGGFDDFPAVLASLAAQDYVVASVDYRLSGEAHFPAALQDVKSAVRWLRGHAEDYGIDTTRVAIWGEEAGGQLAALAGTSCGVSALEPPKTGNQPDPSDCVQAVIDWHGVSDLATLAADSGRDAAGPTPEGAYLGCEPAACAPGLVRTTNPITYIGANTPSFLIQHGAHKNVGMPQSQKLFDALNEAHIPAELHTYGEGEADIAKKAMDALTDFLAKTFPRKPMDKRADRPKSGPLPY